MVNRNVIIFNTVAADNLATQGTRPSSAMALTHFIPRYSEAFFFYIVWMRIQWLFCVQGHLLLTLNYFYPSRDK